MFAGPTLTFAASLIDRNLCMRITVKSTYEMHTCVGVCVCVWPFPCPFIGFLKMLKFHTVL